MIKVSVDDGLEGLSTIYFIIKENTWWWEKSFCEGENQSAAKTPQLCTFWVPGPVAMRMEVQGMALPSWDFQLKCCQKHAHEARAPKAEPHKRM